MRTRRATRLYLVTGALLAFFTIVIVLIDGRGIWRFVVSVFPRRRPPRHRRRRPRGLGTLSAFTRVQIFVAAGNAVGIGIAAWLLGLPLAIPIAVVVFLASFIPSWAPSCRARSRWSSRSCSWGRCRP
ncbi:AI-2E family transporter [Clavibacter michiganensis subsp. insidiosus]|uniref:AI-2E family transporter n=1 Tax=Clavibacter michiganensis TaxID=28447 RepID=UPI00360926E7